MFAFAGLVALVSACTTTPAQPALRALPDAVTAASSTPQPALWAVRDADSVVYLYGTIHMLSAERDWGGPAVRAALADTQEVWTEIEITPPDDPAMIALVQRLGFDPTNPLSRRIPAERMTQLRTLLGGAPKEALDPMKPWMAALTATMVPLVQAGFDPNRSVDSAVADAARSAGADLRWFETAEQQLRFFDSLPEAVQLQMLAESLDQAARGPEMLRDMEGAWAVGDMERLYAVAGVEMLTRYPELYEVLLTRRNAAWVDKIVAELNGSGTDLVAGGALHFTGPNSVNAMLEARGLRVERLTP
jgi:uncharacterized protein YbaP (TraB family)